MASTPDSVGHMGFQGLTVVDLLEDMSFEDGKVYNDKLIPIARGDVLPDSELLLLGRIRACQPP